MTWQETTSTMMEQVRAAYMAEIERLGETLRPRFEKGELRGFRSGDGDVPWPAGTPDWQVGPAPFFAVEALCAEHFGVHVLDSAAAGLVLAGSPHANATGDDGWCHPGVQAARAAVWDLLAVATARGYYTPAADDEPDPILEAAA